MNFALSSLIISFALFISSYTIQLRKANCHMLLIFFIRVIFVVRGENGISKVRIAADDI